MPRLSVDGLPIHLATVSDIGLLVPIPDINEELLVFLVVKVELRKLEAG